MTRTIIDIPDDYKNELLYRAARNGITIRRQVIDALRKEFGWPQDRMPADARYSIDGGLPVLRTNGHTPRDQPLDEKGLTDFTPALERKSEEAARAAGIEPPPPASGRKPKPMKLEELEAIVEHVEKGEEF